MRCQRALEIFFLQQSGKYWVTLQRSLYSLNSAPTLTYWWDINWKWETSWTETFYSSPLEEPEQYIFAVVEERHIWKPATPGVNHLFLLQCRTWRRNVTQRPKNKEKQRHSGQRTSKEKSAYSKRQGVSIDQAQGIRRMGSQTRPKQQGLCILTISDVKTLQEEQLTRLKSCLLNITFSPQPPNMHTKHPPTLVSNLILAKIKNPQIIWF